MLCPQCGKDVGDSARLCETCIRTEEAAPERSEIGRIQVERVLRKVTPEEREAIRRQREEYYSGKVVTDTAEILRDLKKPQDRLLGWGIFFFAGACFLIWFMFWWFGNAAEILLMLEEHKPEQESFDVSVDK